MNFHSSSKKRRVTNKHYPAIVIGAGAAGLFAGSILGRKAIVLEKGDRAGRKLLLTGGGKCNYTHDSELPEIFNHYTADRKFIRDALYAMPPSSIMDYFKELSIEPAIESNGKVFPTTGKAEDVVSALERRCSIEYETEVLSIRKEERFIVETTKGTFTSSAVLIATGGISYPHTGSDGKGYELAKSFGHSIERPVPALAPLALEYSLKEAEGITLNLTIKIGKKSLSDSAVITRRGISGPLAENISYLLPDKREITISFLDITKEEIRAENGKTLLKNTISLPARLTKALLGPIGEKKIAELKKDELNLAIERITSLKTNAFAIREGAMSTHGGVSMREINSRTMESKLIPGLYFAGDVMDVDAECGGYSLTWAFASAYLFAKAIDSFN